MKRLTDQIRNAGAYLLVGAAFLCFVTPPGPWGPASMQRLEFPGGINGVSYINLALIVNAPQLLISTLYFTLNHISTTVATIYEYNQFGMQKKNIESLTTRRPATGCLLSAATVPLRDSIEHSRWHSALARLTDTLPRMSGQAAKRWHSGTRQIKRSMGHIRELISDSCHSLMAALCYRARHR